MTPEELFELEGRRILIVATDAGAALFLSPVIKKLHTRNTVKVVAGIHGAVTFRHQDIPYQAIEVGTPSEIIAQNLLEQGFELALLGTNLGPGLEKALTIKASEFGTWTMAVVDHYWHLWQRFADLEDRELNRYLPNDIWVFERWQKDCIQSKGVPKNQIHVSHHPYLQSLRNKNWLSEKQNFCEEQDIDPDALLIIYASEPPPTGKIDWESEEPTQAKIEEVANMVVNAISRLNHAQQLVHLVVKKHPTESKNFMRSKWAKQGSACTVLSDYPPQKLIQTSDMVLGITSMFMLEAQAMGIPTAILNVKKSYFSEDRCSLRIIHNKDKLIDWVITHRN